MKTDDLKNLVKQKYSLIADQPKKQNETSCCGSSGCCDSVDYTIFSENYHGQNGYVDQADLGLGCGIPTNFAGIKEGDHVLDLGSGAGNDCFVARALTGEKGMVTGLDFTSAMVNKAELNRDQLGYNNIWFVLGDIESMPFDEASFDVVISNCVLNLVPDKQLAFKEIYRVTKSGGHFCVSDVVIRGELPEVIKKEGELYAGCVSGAMDMEEYIQIIRESGFEQITIHKEKEISIPNAILLQYIDIEELRRFKNSRTGIFSITISGLKY
jgi:SAM-dependent methyltransferase